MAGESGKWVVSLSVLGFLIRPIIDLPIVTCLEWMLVLGMPSIAVGVKLGIVGTSPWQDEDVLPSLALNVSSIPRMGDECPRRFNAEAVTLQLRKIGTKATRQDADNPRRLRRREKGLGPHSITHGKVPILPDSGSDSKLRFDPRFNSCCNVGRRSQEYGAKYGVILTGGKVRGYADAGLI